MEHTKHCFLVAYDTTTKSWIIDSETIYFPESPIYDPATQQMRKLRDIEISLDTQLRLSLVNALSSITEGAARVAKEVRCSECDFILDDPNLIAIGYCSSECEREGLVTSV